MNLIQSSGKQRGATLIVSLIMLAVITLMVTSAFTMSSTNLQAVGNMQFRSEATAAANSALEQVISGMTAAAAPVTQTVNVYLANDGLNPYTVTVVPTCITSLAVAGVPPAGSGSGVELGPGMTLNASIVGYTTVWDMAATVQDNATGTSVVIHQGVRKLLTSDCS
jgi:Tfp pilus assembly protein PilX